MKPLSILSVLVAVTFSSCSSKNLPSSVRTVSVAPSAARTPLVLAPTKDEYFTQMATERNPWVVNALRTAIQRELVNGGRFQASPTGTADAEITIETLRHGLIEVSADNYAVQVAGTAVVTREGKQITSRDLAGTSGDIRPLKDFENPENYEAAVQSVVDKVALEMVTTL